MSDTDDLQKKVLEYEDLMVEINKRRNPSSKKGWWEAPGVLPSLTAVLTVALTSIAAFYTQRSMREEDFLTQQSKANYESAVAVVNDAHVLANETLFWAGERDRLNSGEYSKLDTKQKNDLVDSVNASDTRWRSGRDVKRVGLDLLFNGDPKVLDAWDSTVVRLKLYTTCTVIQHGCGSLRQPAESAIIWFRDSAVARLRSARPTVIRQ